MSKTRTLLSAGITLGILQLSAMGQNAAIESLNKQAKEAPEKQAENVNALPEKIKILQDELAALEVTGNDLDQQLTGLQKEKAAAEKELSDRLADLAKNHERNLIGIQDEYRELAVAARQALREGLDVRASTKELAENPRLVEKKIKKETKRAQKEYKDKVKALKEHYADKISVLEKRIATAEKQKARLVEIIKETGNRLDLLYSDMGSVPNTGS